MDDILNFHLQNFHNKNFLLKPQRYRKLLERYKFNIQNNLYLTNSFMLKDFTKTEQSP